MLCLHGWTGSRTDFEAVLDGLAQGRRVVVPDLPGHADSEGSGDEGDHGIGAVARWVEAFADAVGLGELHLLGHSLGGLQAQRVAVNASQRLRSLVLVGTGLGMPDETVAGHVAAIAAVARDRGLDAAWDASRALNDAAGRALDPQRGEVLRERWLRMEPAALIGGARALVSAAPVIAFLRGIDLPVLVVHGEREPMWAPPDQRLLAETIAGAVRVVVPGAEHSPHADRPEAFLAVVAPFLDAAET